MLLQPTGGDTQEDENSKRPGLKKRPMGEQEVQVDTATSGSTEG